MSIDLGSGYRQISLDKNDREKTAFITPNGLYVFKMSACGLCNAFDTFERIMNSLLRGFTWPICLCYLDDIIVLSSTFEEHLERFNKALSYLRNAGLQLNPGKLGEKLRHLSQSR